MKKLLNHRENFIIRDKHLPDNIPNNYFYEYTNTI